MESAVWRPSLVFEVEVRPRAGWGRQRKFERSRRCWGPAEEMGVEAQAHEDTIPVFHVASPSSHLFLDLDES